MEYSLPDDDTLVDSFALHATIGFLGKGVDVRRQLVPIFTFVGLQARICQQCINPSKRIHRYQHGADVGLKSRRKKRVRLLKWYETALERL